MIIDIFCVSGIDVVGRTHHCPNYVKLQIRNGDFKLFLLTFIIIFIIIIITIMFFKIPY